MRRAAFSSIVLLTACLGGALQARSDTVLVSGRFLKMAKAVDVMKIKAIGSAQTKSSPSILQVTPAEAARIEALVTKAGGELIGAPSVQTKLDSQAKIETKSADHSVAMTVLPTSRSTTITLKFKLEVSTKTGTQTITRSATANARVDETKALLVIQNPRDGQPGLLTVLTARRVK
jgi:hypothetical protein